MVCTHGPCSIQAIPEPTWSPYYLTGRGKTQTCGSESHLISLPTPLGISHSGTPGGTWLWSRRAGSSDILSSWELRRESCRPNWTWTYPWPCFLAQFSTGTSFLGELRVT